MGEGLSNFIQMSQPILRPMRNDNSCEILVQYSTLSAT
jgi:hypothetical protein